MNDYIVLVFLAILPLFLPIFFIFDNSYSIKSDTIVRSVIDLARKLKMKTVSEGIEYKDQVEFLKDARNNLEILKQQNKDIVNGSLYFHEDKNGECIKNIDIFKYEFMNRITPCNIQLSKSGYMNNDIKEIEDKFLSYVKDENVKGVNILGGEPLDQIKDNDLLIISADNK